MVQYTDFNLTAASARLGTLVGEGRWKQFSEKLDAGRVASFQIPMAGGLAYNYAAKAVDAEILDALSALAREQQVIAKYKALLDGQVMNTGEKRLVLHHLARAFAGTCLGSKVMHGGRDLGAFYAAEAARFGAFADAVHGGALLNEKGETFNRAVQIGIGGSDLGPRALYLALDNWAIQSGSRHMRADFISNVDPDDAAKVMAEDPSRTLFILVSKSGTTQETLANELFVKARLDAAGLDAKAHMVAVTSETSPLARNPAYLDSFYIDDFIGGRYSSTSAVGGVILSLAFGKEAFLDLLKGANEADAAALQEDPLKNAALLDALIGAWERNFLAYPATAVLPYSQALSRFPAHLQQLDMESNGKRVNRDGQPVDYATGPIVFGEPGTNGQHSFYQLLHQGTDVVPLQFVGFRESQLGADVEVDGSTSQAKLAANLAAQIVAFAKGKADENPNKNFPGGRPSSLIVGDRLTPAALGSLLAHFENKVMFQGFIWNINSFDQEGVQLGKILAKKVLAGAANGGGTGDSGLDAYAALLGL